MRNLVDDDEFDFTYQLALGTCVFQRFLDMPTIVARIVGQQGMEGQTEETVERGASGVDGRDARRGKDYVLLLRVLRDVAEKSALARACLSREEKRAAGVVHNLQGVLPLLVFKV